MRRFLLILACCLGLFSSDVFALTDEEIFRNFQFTFVNPGARSGAMGGAFIGLADDATAAEANPAGLTILTKPEVSFEYRNTEYDASQLDDFNFVANEDLGLTVVSDSELDELNQPSWLSFVYPIGRTTVAFSRQEVSRTEGALNDFFFLTLAGFEPTTFQTQATQDQKIVNYNFSFGTKLGDKFSVGATARFSQIDWQSQSISSIQVDENTDVPLFQTLVDDKDNAFGWNVGMIYTTTYFSFGAVYKRNPKFEVEEIESGPASARPGTFANVLKVPDTFGFGMAVKPNDKLTVVVDVNRIEYSDLVEDISVGRNVLFSGFTEEDVTYIIEDDWDFHVGTEFVVFVGKVPVALRQGYYRRASSSLLVDETPGLSDLGNQVLNTLFPEREAENHFTFGNGFVFGNNFQIDWAADLSNLSDQFILSTVVRF